MVKYSMFVLMANGMAGYSGSTLEATVFAIRKIRVMVCVLSWIHWYYLNRGGEIVLTSKWWDIRSLVVSGNGVIMLNALLGGILLVLRSWIGQCKNTANDSLCNAYDELNELPWLNVIVNILGLIVLPSLFKIHSVNCLIVSWCFNVAAIVVSWYKVRNTDDILLLSVILFGIGVTLYDKRKDTITMF